MSETDEFDDPVRNRREYSPYCFWNPKQGGVLGLAHWPSLEEVVRAAERAFPGKPFSELKVYAQYCCQDCGRVHLYVESR